MNTNESTDENAADLMTRDELAEYAGVTPRTVDRWATAGKLTRHKSARGARKGLTRYSRKQADELIKFAPETEEAASPEPVTLDDPGARGRERSLSPEPIRGRAFGPAGG
jgi:hypothetical protein